MLQNSLDENRAHVALSRLAGEGWGEGTGVEMAVLPRSNFCREALVRLY
jgi:hypothetical protein